MNTAIPAIQVTAAHQLPAERHILLPHGRIGVLSMLFRWFLWYMLMLGTGLLLQSIPEPSRYLVSAIISYPAFALLIVTAIKRGHDMGYSAWGVIILALLPILLLLPGDKQPNKYGPVPTRKL
jgi:uncharacterized membrane protein YhaH (DUF805 family)